MAEWNDRLRAVREAAGLSQAALATRAGVSEETVFSYEAGRRHPTRDTLVRLLRAVGCAPQTMNSVTTAAGFDPEPTGRLADLAARRASLDALQREALAYPWPCLITNERTEVVAWNTLATRVAELDFGRELPLPRERNLFRMAAMPHFRDRVVNWDAVVSFLIAQYKSNHMDITEPEEDSQYFWSVVEDIVHHHSDIFPRLLQLWQTVPSRPEGGRDTFPAVWQVADGTVLRFTCVLSSWSDFEAAWAFDWHPADAATWGWLRRVTAVAPQPTDEVLATTPEPPSRSALTTDGTVAATASWRDLLRLAREGTALSRRQLAEAAGDVSEETVRSYETGRRRPVRETLVRLTRAMELDGVTANALLTAAGFEAEPSEWALFLAGVPRRTDAKRYQPTGDVRRSRGDMQRAIAAHAWPCLIVDRQCEVICWNVAATRVVGLDIANPPTSLSRNLIPLAVSRHFRDHLVNWAEVVTALIPATLKTVLVAGDQGLRSGQLQSLADDIRRQGSEVLQELTELWRGRASAPTTARVVFPLIWRHDRGEVLAFNVIVAPWSAFDDAWAIDWHPADAETWTWLGNGR